jgi:hypothetical protein
LSDLTGGNHGDGPVELRRTVVIVILMAMRDTGLFIDTPRPRRQHTKLETPPRPKRPSGSWERSLVPKPIRKNSAAEVAQKTDPRPSPKRKTPRVGQKGIQKLLQPVKRRKLLSTSTRSSSQLPSQLVSPNNAPISIEDDGGLGTFSSFDTWMDDESPDDIGLNGEINLTQSISEIETQQALQLPTYRSLLLGDAESYVRLTARCYIIQDWNPKYEVLSVRTSHWPY